MNVTIEGNKVTMSLEDFISLTSNETVIQSTNHIQMATNSEEVDITKYLIEKGLKRGIKGFDYLRTAITNVLNNKDLKAMMGENGVYDIVSNEYDTTASRVERAIRHSLGITFKDRKPTNAEFIFSAADDIRLSRLNCE